MQVFDIERAEDSVRLARFVNVSVERSPAVSREGLSTETLRSSLRVLRASNAPLQVLVGDSNCSMLSSLKVALGLASHECNIVAPAAGDVGIVVLQPGWVVEELKVSIGNSFMARPNQPNRQTNQSFRSAKLQSTRLSARRLLPAASHGSQQSSRCSTARSCPPCVATMPWRLPFPRLPPVLLGRRARFAPTSSVVLYLL